ncbi:hypothetical protein [Psychroserpens damuponensis]|uniref:hypothetical protein n=1 Tax=Psychroserpens damuponensis TaxID=943936 RepID=UPI00058E2E63|nr:hypothetical protein [Psychroserpens damuponensis]
MFENALLKDGQFFIKSKKINAKRPSEYWLLFLKRFVLSYKKPRFQTWMVMFFVPLLVFAVLFVLQIDSELTMVITIISVFLSFFIGLIWKFSTNIAFVPLEEFHDLARFIISIKGDIYKNMINLRLNTGVIEDKLNLLNPSDIGLQRASGVKYHPYQLERFKAVFHLKDATVCTISLHQITLRVTTTKRRSSGKTKTKMKRKHKYFHALTLKLDASQYEILNQERITNTIDGFYDIRVKTDAGFHYVKVKTKQKLTSISSEIKKHHVHKDSIFTEMMHYLESNSIVNSKPSQILIQ